MRKWFCMSIVAAFVLAALPTAGFIGLSQVHASAPTTFNGVGQNSPMGWDDWNSFACNNDAVDVEANAQFIHDSGLQGDGYQYVINDGCWNDLVGTDPAQYPSGSSTPAQPDPGGGSQTSLPATAEERVCGVSTSG